MENDLPGREGAPSTPGCPYCGSVDVRRSRRSWGLDHLGLHLLRCLACGGGFWRTAPRLEALRALRRAYLEAPAPRRAPPRG